MDAFGAAFLPGYSSAMRTPVHQMRTFQLDQPLATHYRRATCDEVQCQAQAAGWRMAFDLTDPDKREAARFIRDKAGRSYTYELFDEGRRIVFTFAAGQRCFAQHRVPLERDPFMIVRSGDIRGSGDGWRMQHTSAESMLDHWSSDLDQLNTIRERG